MPTTDLVINEQVPSFDVETIARAGIVWELRHAAESCGLPAVDWRVEFDGGLDIEGRVSDELGEAEVREVLAAYAEALAAAASQRPGDIEVESVEVVEDDCSFLAGTAYCSTYFDGGSLTVRGTVDRSAFQRARDELRRMLGALDHSACPPRPTSSRSSPGECRTTEGLPES